MSISNTSEYDGIAQISAIVASTLRQMRSYAQPGMSTKELDDYGATLLRAQGAQSAPMLTYGFPGWTCISVNEAFAHGIPSHDVILREGDLVNIDVSAECDGFWADNGCSFVLGNDVHGHQALVDASERILRKAIQSIKGGVRISDIGHIMQREAKRCGYRVIKNLAGHGVGRSLHEKPFEIPNYRDRFNKERFRKNTVIAVETFIATQSTKANTLDDGWTLVGNRGGFTAQHEHTLIVTDGKPEILTSGNSIGF